MCVCVCVAPAPRRADAPVCQSDAAPAWAWESCRRPCGCRPLQVEDEEEELVLSLPGCFLWLTAVTVLISVLSDIIVNVRAVCSA